jgi:succinoglycan biosynthesis transport protein ExoP
MATPDNENLPVPIDASLAVPRSGEVYRSPEALTEWEFPPPEGPSTPAASLPSPLSLVSLKKAFFHRWLLALSVGLSLSAVFGGAAWYFLPAKYTSYALLRVAEAEPQPLIPDQRGSSTQVERYFENTQVALIKSRPIIQAALRQPGIDQLNLIRSQPDPALWLEEELKVAFLDKTDILRVSLDGTDPKELADLVNAVKEAYMQEEVNAQRDKKKNLLDDLEKVYISSEEKLHNQRATLRELAQRLKSSDVQALSVKQKAILDEYAVLRKELSLLQAQVRGAEIALAVHKASGDNAGAVAIPEVVLEQAVEADPVVVQKKMELAQFESKLNQLAGMTEPGHPTRDRYERERKGLEDALEQRRTRLRATLGKQVRDKTRAEQDAKDAQARENLEVWRQQESLLKGEVDRVLKEAQNIGITTFELEQRRSELEQAEAVIRRLREEKERLQVELQSSKQRVSVLHKAEIPTKKNLMAQVRVVGFVGAVGFLLGLVGVCYWEARTHRIRSKDEVIDVLGCRVVGVLPWVSAESRRAVGPASDPVALLTSSVDDLRALLLCETEEQEGGSVLVVTSAVAREGKTTLASHLAVSLAQAGRRTLLVDGDFRRPQLHHVFGVPLGPGLCEVLRGATTAAEANRPGPLPGLTVLAAGERSYEIDSAKVMAQMRGFLEWARKEYDFILVDSAPVLPVADALLLGKRADGVLLSVRPGVSQFPLVSAAFERLGALRIRVLGTVVNGVHSRSDGYDYGYVVESRAEVSER